MTIMKTLPMIEKPIEELHQAMVEQGFSRKQRIGGLEYSTKIHDASRASFYRLVIPLKKHRHENHDAICFGQAYMVNVEHQQKEIPDSVREAARSKLAELADYLLSNQSLDKTNEKPHLLNGTMAPTMDDMVSLGKEMDSMYTNQELAERGFIPDPVQHNWTNKQRSR